MRPSEKSARTPSTPSSDVPDIKPMNSSAAIAERGGRGVVGPPLLPRGCSVRAGLDDRERCSQFGARTDSDAFEGRAHGGGDRGAAFLGDRGRVLVFAVHAELE